MPELKYIGFVLDPALEVRAVADEALPESAPTKVGAVTVPEIVVVPVLSTVKTFVKS